MYIKPMVTFLGAFQKILFLLISQNIDGFRQNNSLGFLIEFMREIFHFQYMYLPKLCFGFKDLLCTEY